MLFIIRPGFIGAGHILYRRYEAVTRPSDGFDVARRDRRIAEHDPEAFRGCIEPALEVDNRVARPQPPLQFLPADDFAPLLDEGQKKVERFFLKTEAQAVLTQFARTRVQLEVVKSNST